MNLIYIADPMCSWCYGFSQSMDALLAQPGEAAPLQLALIMGGLRPYTADPISPAFADEILGHWKHVHEATGVPFCGPADSAMYLPGFIYDTEPASRATATVRACWPRLVWRYFKAIQHAFYAEGKNVVRPEVLADIAEALGIPRQDFALAFASDAMRDATRQDFDQAKTWGIRGFPALVAEYAGGLHLVTRGYAAEDLLRERIHAMLVRH